MEPVKYFFSYSRQNAEFVIRLAADLKQAGAHVWLDQMDIAPGTRWDDAIEGALNESTGLLVVLSNASVKSQNVLDEVSYAISQGKKIVPLMLERCPVPFRLARFQHIDFTGNYDASLKRLQKALGSGQPGMLPGATPPDVASIPLSEEENTVLNEGASQKADRIERTIGDHQQHAYKTIQPDTASPQIKRKNLITPVSIAASVLVAVITVWLVLSYNKATDKPLMPVAQVEHSENKISSDSANTGKAEDRENKTRGAKTTGGNNTTQPPSTEHDTDTKAVSAAALYRAGVNYYYNLHDYDKGKENLIKAANAGLVTAMKELGKIYNPIVVQPGSVHEVKAVSTAIHWYLAAASKHDIESMFIVSQLYFNKRDDGNGGIWLTKAADNNNVTAMSELGLMYLYGRSGFSQDDGKAAQWFKKAMEFKSPETRQDTLAKYKAMGYYGILVNEGRGGLAKSAVGRRYIGYAYQQTGITYFDTYIKSKIDSTGIRLPSRIRILQRKPLDRMPATRY